METFISSYALLSFSYISYFPDFLRLLQLSHKSLSYLLSMKAIESLTKLDVAEIRTLQNPPVAVIVVLEAVVVLLTGVKNGSNHRDSSYNFIYKCTQEICTCPDVFLPCLPLYHCPLSLSNYPSIFSAFVFLFLCPSHSPYLSTLHFFLTSSHRESHEFPGYSSPPQWW